MNKIIATILFILLALNSNAGMRAFNWGLANSGGESVDNLDITAWWKLNGTMEDAIGGNNGASSGTFIYTNGVSANGVFLGATGYMQIDRYNISDSSFGFSIWVKLDDGQTLASTSDIYHVLDQGSYNDGTINFFIRGGNYNGVMFRVLNSGVWTSIKPSTDSSSIFLDYEWHNIVVTRNSSGLALLYIDGELKQQSDFSDVLLLDSNDYRIGGSLTTSISFVDEFMYFDREITNEEVLILSDQDKY